MVKGVYKGPPVEVHQWRLKGSFLPGRSKSGGDYGGVLNLADLPREANQKPPGGGWPVCLPGPGAERGGGGPEQGDWPAVLADFKNQ